MKLSAGWFPQGGPWILPSSIAQLRTLATIKKKVMELGGNLA